MTALNKQALEHLTRKLTRRLNDAYGFSRTSKGKHTTITLSIGECRELIYVIESAGNRAEAAEKRIAELEAREVKGILFHTISEANVYVGEPEPLYAAPQLPQTEVLSVPDGVLKSLLPDVEKSEFWFEHNGKIFFEGVRFNNAVFEACRAAMLQAGNSPVTPDGWIPVSERMPEAEGRYWCYVEEQNCLGKSHYQWNCSWNGDRWWVESDNGGRVTHWMELPAAPQQE